MWVINLKENSPPLDLALAQVKIEIEQASFAGERVLKILHGYGSHGKGGVILTESRKLLSEMKKKGQIQDFFFGDKWNNFDEKTKKLIMQTKALADDEDLNKNNPGITIVVLK